MEKYQIQEMPGQWFEGAWLPRSEERQQWEALMGEPRIYADLMKTAHDREGLALLCFGTRADLRQYGMVLQEGMLVPFWTDSDQDEALLFDGHVSFDTNRQYWIAVIDQDSFRYVTDANSDAAST